MYFSSIHGIIRHFSSDLLGKLDGNLKNHGVNLLPEFWKCIEDLSLKNFPSDKLNKAHDYVIQSGRSWFNFRVSGKFL